VTIQQLTPKSLFEKLTWTWQGHRIQYTVMGTGQPLVLVHGFGASIGHWRKNIPVLATGGYRHIQEPAVFVGNSIGALLSLMVVADHPEISAGGVLINCAGGLSHRPHELNPPLRLVMGTFNRLVSSRLTGPVLFNLVRQKAQIRRTVLQVYRNPEAVTDELVDILYAPSCDPGAQQVFASILSAPPGPTPAELLPKVKRPLLVIWGADDPWTPISGAKIFDFSRESGQPIQIIPIPNAGHCPHDERPEVVNPLILNWLGQTLLA